MFVETSTLDIFLVGDGYYWRTRFKGAGEAVRDMLLEFLHPKQRT